SCNVDLMIATRASVRAFRSAALMRGDSDPVKRLCAWPREDAVITASAVIPTDNILSISMPPHYGVSRPPPMPAPLCREIGQRDIVFRDIWTIRARSVVAEQL